MNEEKVQELKDALRSVVDMIIQRGAPVSNEIKELLLQVMQHVENRIQELRNEGMGVEPPAKPPKVPSGMPSSNVAGMQYDDKSQNLWVQFLGKYPNRSGPVYQYGHVPKVIAELLQSGAIPARTDGKNKWGQWWKGKVPSAGASVYTLLKNQSYPYQKLS